MTRRAQDLREHARAIGAAVTPWLACLLAGIAALYAIAPPLEPGWHYVLLDAGGAAAMLATWWGLTRLPAAYAHVIVFFAVLAAVGVGVGFVGLTGDPSQSVVLVIVLIGAGSIVLTMTSAVTLAVITLTAWLAVSGGFDDDARAHWLTNLISSSVVSVAIAWSRIRLFGKLQRARDDALASARAKGEFLANVSHELRTPMNGVLGMTHLLLADAKTAETREQLSVIKDSGESMLRLIDELLDFERLSVGKLRLHVAPFDPAHVARSVIQLLTPQAHARGNALRLDLADDLPRAVRGDPERTRQVLLNLVGNAAKFTDGGAVDVRVSARAEGDGWLLRFEVRDTGPGIADGLRGVLFEPFAQGDASTTRRHGGTGLGLAVSRSLARLMGGDVDYDSELGAGTTFWFTARVGRAAAGDAVVDEIGARRRSAVPAAATGRLLVAEDNPVNQRVLEHLLTRLGYQVSLVADGRAALRALDEQPFDAVLMDCQMPELDGYEATRELRRREGAERRMPVIAVTAHAMRGDREKCLDAGMDDYLTKPIRPDELQRVLARWVAPSLGAANVLNADALAKLRRLQTAKAPQFFAELVDLYIDDVGKLRVELRERAGAGDWARVSAIAHRMKSASATVGAMTVASLCHDLEHAEAGAAPDLVDRLDAALDAAVAALRNEQHVA